MVLDKERVSRAVKEKQNRVLNKCQGAVIIIMQKMYAWNAQ